MKLLVRFVAATLLISGSLCAQDIVGRWAGVAATTDDAGTRRQERQTLEIKTEDSKLSGLMVGRNGGGFPLQVQQDGARFNFYSFLVPNGGEHLRWKFELKDGSLVGTFSAQHDNPTQWKYDRIGAMTLTRGAPPAAAGPLISENFESGRIDPNVWELRIAGPVEIKVVQDQSAHGKYALQLHYPAGAARIPQGTPNAGPAFGYLVAKNIPEAARSHLFGRAYLKVTELPLAHTQIFFADGSGFPVSKYQEIGLNFPQPANPGDPSKPVWLANYQEMAAKTRQEGRGEDVWRGDADPYNKWMLVEWEFSDNPSYTKLWIDGQPVTMSQKDQKGDMAQFHWPAGSETNNNLVGGYREVGFGARPWGQVAKDFDILLDDLVIDTKRIGPAK